MPPPEPAAKHTTPESLLKECEAIEAELAALKVAYEQYFLGAERHPPLRDHEALKKRVVRVQSGFVRNTAMKFRVQSLQSKFLTYERLWQRTLQEIESGTYRRDLAKARRRAAAKSPQDAQRAAAASTAPRGTVELEDDSDFDLDRALAGLEATEAPLPQPVIKVQVAAPVPGPAIPAAAAPPRPAPAAPSVAVPAAPPIPSTTRPATAAAPPGLRAPGSAAAPPTLRPAAPPQPLPQGATPPPARAVALGPALSGTAPARPASPAAPPRAPAAPAAAPPRPPVAGSGPGISDDKLRAVYDAYVTAKRRCQEDTSKLSFESVAGNLRKQVPELMRQHNAKAVEFKVVIKDGKAMLKAVPK